MLHINKSKSLGRYLSMAWLISMMLIPLSVWAQDTTIRVGVLKFGTVNWELKALQRMQLDKTNAINLKITEFAGLQATKVALQANEVDIIVADWFWVSRQRAMGRDFTFTPYSQSVGALLVPNDSSIKNLADLKGKRLGIAGGALDKTWLLARAVAKVESGIDLNHAVEKVFGAPPLISKQLELKRVDAVINFWHYAARLEAQGISRLMDAQDLISTLGVETAIPFIGYVFREGWAEINKKALHTFLALTRQSKSEVCHNDTQWDKTIPLTKTKNLKEQKHLREAFCKGILKSWGEQQQKAAHQIYTIMEQLAGKDLIGDSKQLSPGTFWKDYRF